MSGVRRAILAFAALLWLFACSLPPPVAGPGRFGGAHYSYELLSRWSILPPGSDPDVAVVQLTRRGPLLDRMFLASLAPGEGVVTPGFEDYPRWWETTPADGLEAFLSDTLTVLGYERVEVTDKRAQAFAGAPGVRYALRFRRPGGLAFQGEALARVSEGRLDLLLFLAPREHYFPEAIFEVDHVFDSLAPPGEPISRR